MDTKSKSSDKAYHCVRTTSKMVGVWVGDFIEIFHPYEMKSV